jgi:hypothetical protein
MLHFKVSYTFRISGRRVSLAEMRLKICVRNFREKKSKFKISGCMIKTISKRRLPVSHKVSWPSRHLLRNTKKKISGLNS